ncbi:MAG TPA: rod shape-determining protein MreC [Bacteroidia bacterium]|jgi:rod shape-determining protein MreC|nr:rod shape-determining protein MreC [Bacteroidia bacterium]
MRNLLTFIYKNYFFFLFLLLESLAVYLIVKNNYYHRASFVNSSNALASKLYSTYDEAIYYFNLKETNRTLAKENALLRSRLSESFVDFTTRWNPVSDTALKQKYEYVDAKVVNNSTNRRNNYLTLNRGRKQGIEPDMAVISTSGIVGVVDQVSDNFCTVMSILHKDTHVNVKIKKDGNFGSLSWDGTDYTYATITGLPTHTRMTKGDTVVVGSLSRSYPENILVGIVETYGIKSGETSYTVKVKLSTEFKKLEYVYIVKNFFADEQKQLEEKNKNDK